MENPLEQPAPDNPIDRVHAFALDLAWGATHGLWGTGFRILIFGGMEQRWLSLSSGEAPTNLRNLIVGKWKGKFPETSLLLSYGYLEPNYAVKPVDSQPAFLLTQQAFAILENSAISPFDATVTYKYMEMAEQLLDGLRPEHVHIPAAVLAGIQLEIGLRRLCLRQSPPVETKKENGQTKRLNSLIDELQGKAFKPAKADQLRSWAKTRNSAGHGEVEDFTRADVEYMITGIKRFLAEHDL